jgi:hypothetical protein
MAIRASDRASSTGRLRLTVDDAGLDGQLLDRGRHEREAVGEIMAVSGELPNATAAPICQDAESIVVIAATCNPTGGSRFTLQSALGCRVRRNSLHFAAS